MQSKSSSSYALSDSPRFVSLTRLEIGSRQEREREAPTIPLTNADKQERMTKERDFLWRENGKQGRQRERD
jgi:hypothetical protein